MLELQVKDYRRPSQAHGSWMEWGPVVHNNAKRRQDYLCNLKRRFTWLVLIIVSRKLSQMSSNVFAGMSRQMVPFSSILLSSKSECNDRVATYGFDQRLPPSSTSSSNLTHLGLKWHFYKIQLSRHFLSICFRSDPERMMSYPSVTVHPSIQPFPKLIFNSIVLKNALNVVKAIFKPFETPSLYRRAAYKWMRSGWHLRKNKLTSKILKNYTLEPTWYWTI